MKTDRKSRTSNRKTPLVAGLVLALGLFTGNGNAQWIVNDPMVNGTSIADMAQTWAEFLEQANRWQRQISEFQDALTQVTSIMQNPGSLMGGLVSNDMNKVAEDAGDEIHCPTPGGGGDFSLTTLFSLILPNPNGNIIEQQVQLCKQANHLRNKKYNEAVDMVKEVKDRHKKIDELIAQAKSSNTEGSYRAAMLSGQTVIASTLVDMQYAQTRFESYDVMIAKVERDSNGLAKQMMDGKKSILGSVVSTAALATALEVAD